MHFSAILCAFVATLVCVSSASPVPAPTPDDQSKHMLYPRMPYVRVQDEAKLTVGTFVFVPLKGANGATTQAGSSNRHAAVILGPAVDGLYPIAYISHDPAHTETVHLDPPVPNVGDVNLIPGWKSSAALVNIFMADPPNTRMATTAEVAEMKKSQHALLIFGTFTDLTLQSGTCPRR